MLIASYRIQDIVSGNLVLTYQNGHQRTVEMRASPAWSFLMLSHGDLVVPYTWTANGIDCNTSHIFECTVGLEFSARNGTTASVAASSLASITLPDTRKSSTRIHVFAASLWLAAVGNDTNSSTAAQA